MRRIAQCALFAFAVACSGGEQTATVKANPAPPDTITKLRNELTAAIVASEASCSAQWLEKNAEPACARWPRRALSDPAQSWMLTDATLASVAAAAKRESSNDLKALHGRLLSERVLRDAPDASALVTLAKALKYADVPALLSDMYGFDVRATAAQAARAMNASEGLYLVARTDVAVAAADADASITGIDAKAVADTAWPGDAFTVSAIEDASATGAAPFFVSPTTQRIIVPSISDLGSRIRAFAFARSRNAVGTADFAMALVPGFIVTSIASTPEYLTSAAHVTEPALTRVVRVSAYRAIEGVRADAARVIDMLAYYDGGQPIADASDPYMMAAVRFRGRLLAAKIVSDVTSRYGASFWQSPEAVAAIKTAQPGDTVDSDALLVASARALARSEPLVTLQ